MVTVDTDVLASILSELRDLKANQQRLEHKVQSNRPPLCGPPRAVLRVPDCSCPRPDRMHAFQLEHLSVGAVSPTSPLSPTLNPILRSEGIPLPGPIPGVSTNGTASSSDDSHADKNSRYVSATPPSGDPASPSLKAKKDPSSRYTQRVILTSP
jgi:hypothetical protein